MQIFDPLHPIRYKRLAWYIKHLPGLVAYYPLNEVSGTVARNYAPSTLGTLNGTITGATVGQDGLIGKAYSFDGNGDVVDLGNDSSLVAGSGNFSFGCLVKGTVGLGNQYPIASSIGASDAGYDILLPNANPTGGVIVRVHGTLLTNLSSNARNITINTWNFVVGVLNRSTESLDCYANGISATTKDTTGLGVVNNSQNPKIGLRGSNYITAPGIQHAFFVNRALTSTEILRMTKIAGLV